jgi:hypothetical protein
MRMGSTASVLRARRGSIITIVSLLALGPKLVVTYLGTYF